MSGRLTRAAILWKRSKIKINIHLQYVITAAIVLCLGAIAWEDLKYRAVTWWLFPALALLAVAWGFLSGNMTQKLGFAGVNLLFIGFQVVTLSGYLALKYKTFVNPFHSHFGLGDLLFLIAVAPAFAPLNFIFFLISAFIFSILLHVLCGRLSIDYNKTRIPLAGLSGVFYIVLLVVSTILQIDLWDDAYILTAIGN